MARTQHSYIGPNPSLKEAEIFYFYFGMSQLSPTILTKEQNQTTTNNGYPVRRRR